MTVDENYDQHARPPDFNIAMQHARATLVHNIPDDDENAFDGEK